MILIISAEDGWGKRVLESDVDEPVKNFHRKNDLLGMLL